ncbi:MAG: serine hydrolase domain-containing protein [Gemmatimonadaceae bacterium]
MTSSRRLFAYSVAMLAATMPAAAQRTATQGPRADSTLARRVDSLFSRNVRPDGPGCAVGIYRNGKVVLTRGYGLVSVEDGRRITPQTTFNLGSASKPFTALAALVLEQQGKLSLDDDVRRWVPELPDYGTTIRVRDLLQHTSGLRDYGALNVLVGREVVTMREFLSLLAAQQALNFAPGTTHEYSHSDFVLLGPIIERVTGVPFDQHLTVAALCNSDDLEAWRLAPEVADIYLGDLMRPVPRRSAVPAAVTLSPRELTRYAGVYRLPDQPWMLTPIEVRNGTIGEVLFHDVRGDTLITMTPAGADRFFEIGLTGNLGMFTFRPAAPGVPPRLELSWNDGPAEVMDRIPDSALWRPSAAALAEYAGVWFSQEINTGWQLKEHGEKLVLRRPGRADLALWPVERDVFVRGFGSWEEPLMTRLHFHRDAAGKLTHLSLSTPSGENAVKNLRFVRVTP